MGWELAKRTFGLRRCRRIAREPSVCRQETGLSQSERLANRIQVWPKLKSISPALFKVEAKFCKVALLGSTPRVSEKSLGCFHGQHVLFDTIENGAIEKQNGKESRIGSLIGNVHVGSAAIEGIAQE